MIHEKYAKALELYKNTNLAHERIAELYNVSPIDFAKYLCEYHQDIVDKRNSMNISVGKESDIKLKKDEVKSSDSSDKYHEAIDACMNIKFIFQNVAEVAQFYHLNPTALISLFEAHFSQVLKWRDHDYNGKSCPANKLEGTKDEKKKVYAEAMKLLSYTDMSIPEVASYCGVSINGLKRYVQSCPADMFKNRLPQREGVPFQSPIDFMNKKRSSHHPKQKTVQKYAEALECYKNTSLTIKEVCSKTNVSVSGFTNYLYVWHRDLLEQRNSI